MQTSLVNSIYLVNNLPHKAEICINSQKENNSFHFLQSECMGLFGVDMFLIMDKIQNFMPLYGNSI